MPFLIVAVLGLTLILILELLVHRRARRVVLLRSVGGAGVAIVIVASLAWAGTDTDRLAVLLGVAVTVAIGTVVVLTLRRRSGLR